MTGPTGSEDSIERRVPGSRVKLWLLLGANRWLVAGALLGAFFAGLLLLGVLDPSPLRAAVDGKDPVETVFQALLTAIVTGVTLVVTINQLVLSQELGALGDQRERMAGAMEFRRDLEPALEAAVSPAGPAAFLRAIVDAVAARGERLPGTLGGTVDEDLAGRVRAYAEELRENATAAGRRLDGAEFGSFEVVRAALGFDYSGKLHRARRLEAEAGLGEGTREALGEVIDLLERFAPAREHVKTLYSQWELIDLSRAVVYASVPALLVATAMLLHAGDPGSIRGATLGVDNLLLAVCGASTVALLPFALLLSFMLRIMTVAKRTLAAGPFVLRSRD